MSSQSGTKKNTILIVEDEPELIAFYDEFLNNSYGTAVSCSGADALRIMNSTEHVDPVIIGHKLQEMSGLDVANQRISTRKRSQRGGAALMTASPQPAWTEFAAPRRLSFGAPKNASGRYQAVQYAAITRTVLRRRLMEPAQIRVPLVKTQGRPVWLRTYQRKIRRRCPGALL
jgi:CheY-like chemotaxis protein